MYPNPLPTPFPTSSLVPLSLAPRQPSDCKHAPLAPSMRPIRRMARVAMLSLAWPSTCLRLLAVFRPRSSHTSRFHPLDHWTLPMLELQERWRTESGNKAIDLRLESLPGEGFEHFRYIDTTSDFNELIQAARGCILLHGLYHLYWEDFISSLHSQELVNACQRDSHQYSLACTIPMQPWLPTSDMHELWLNPVHQHLHAIGKVPSPHRNSSQSVRYQIFVNPDRKYIYFCKELIRGMAAPIFGYIDLNNLLALKCLELKEAEIPYPCQQLKDVQ